ncbi:glutamate--cysteine ligase [Georgenia sp. 311]|uniref:glutamate--cysteine ligase n=1 Tax=Georgenia sp. 311 TaxID=2585134 RepID=UPI001111BB51|nr:glutamate--cysteine ligase [Georgenia sp. 311]TNC19252.1 glutamate--cysteine ligase [Georgenia sp. 311]
MEIPFAPSARSTIGIEWELALVDADSGHLRQVAPTVLEGVRPAGADAHPNVHPELLLNTIEVVSGVAATVREAGTDLERTIEELRAVCEPLRVDLMCAGTHPFAQYDDQRVTNKERYATLIERTQWWGRQMVIYGVHVHVGVEHQRKVLPILRAMLSYFPHLQSLSASSPFWSGRDTGYASNRALLFQQLPTAGLPQLFDQWQELEAYTRDMLHTGVIDHFNEVRWDIRPAPHLGTLEMRVFDGASNLTEVLALAALTHCLVEHFSTMLDEGRELPRMPAWYLHENKWRSARYGMDAIVILDAAGNEQLVTDSLDELLRTLEPVADRLGCLEELDGVRTIIRKGASYQRQRRVARRNDGDLDAVVASLVAEMRAGRPL